MPDLRAALERITDGIIVYDPDWRITYLNGPAAEFIGQSREGMVGKTYEEAFPKAVGSEIQAQLRRAAAGTEPVEFEFLGLQRQIWIAMRAYPSEGGLTTYFRDVTARRRAEDALRESEERHRAVVEHALAGILLTVPTGEILAANPAACRMLGRTEAEICAAGRNGIVDVTDPRGAAFFEERRRTGFARGELALVHKDGRRLTVELASAIYRDAAGRERTSMSFIDLTERKRAEDALRLLVDASAALSDSLDLRTTVENLTALLVPRLADACMVDVVEGEALHRLAVVGGVGSEGELVEMLRCAEPAHDGAAGVGKVLRTGEAELVPTVTDEYMRAAAFSEAHYRAARGLAPKSALVVPLKVRGETVGALTLAMTTSERRFDAADLSVAANLADRAAIAIEHARIHQASIAAKQVRDEMLGIVSHDLRNPLNSISLVTQVLLRRTPDDPELASIRQAVFRADRLIQDLLTAARVDAGELPVDRRAESVRALVDEVATLHRPLADERSVAFDVEVDDRCPSAHIDRHRVAQLLSNLLSNATKFTPAGGKVTLRVSCTPAALTIIVSDTGEGIDRKHLDHVFDRFWQGAHAHRAGAGLGLAIVKGIVVAHGGDIRVESELGKGTAFTVVLPNRAS